MFPIGCVDNVDGVCYNECAIKERGCEKQIAIWVLTFELQCAIIRLRKQRKETTMKDLDFYTRYAKSILTSLNIPFVDCTVSVNTRLNSVWGRCHHEYAYNHTTHRIELNKVLVTDTVSDDALMNTLLHEYLHTCPNCNNHGKQWKYYAQLINQKYHYNIKRTTSCAEKGIVEEKKKPRYTVTCPRCGSVSSYLRKSNVVDAALNNRMLRCGCGYSGRDFEVEHLL